jgi:hypothetical protein
MLVFRFDFIFRHRGARMTTHLPAKSTTRREGHAFRLATIAAFLAVMFAPTAQAQAPAATASVAAAPNPADLEKLVDRIALYPGRPGRHHPAGVDQSPADRSGGSLPGQAQAGSEGCRSTPSGTTR